MPASSQTDSTILIRRLTDLGELRVWSVIVTVFGDFTLLPNDSLSATRLLSISGRIGIRPDAIRVAIHRLKNDGWLTSLRHGRNSTYRLTDFGYEQCQAARSRIYAPAPAPAGQQVLVILPSPDHEHAGRLDLALRDAGYDQVAPRLYLGNHDDCPEDPNLWTLRIEPQSIPTWVKHILAPKELISAYAALESALLLTQEALARGDLANRDDLDAVRVLVIHRWRQLLLRHQDLPPEYFPDGWRAESCRKLVQELLHMLPTISNAAQSAHSQDLVRQQP